MPSTEPSAGAASALRDLNREDRNAVMRAMRWHYGMTTDAIADAFDISDSQVCAITGRRKDPVHAAWTPRMLAVSIREKPEPPSDPERPAWSYPGPALHLVAQEARRDVEDAMARGFDPARFRR